MNWTLNDFLATYPPVNAEHFQTLISAKKEFNELPSGVSEPTPKKGDLYQHQEFFKRYMKNYNDILNISSGGTGKTCTVVGFVEYLISEHVKAINPTVSHFKRAVILLKGPTLINEYKYQIACKCTKDLYQSDTVDPIKAKKQISKLIDRWYKFYTYQEFAKLIKTYTLDGIQKDFNHSIVVVDEAHNLFVDDDTIKAIRDDVKWTKEDTYHYIHLFLHTINHCKKILATATPMLNGTIEFGKLLNLIVDHPLPLEESFYNQPVEKIEPYIRGYITFVRGLETGVTRVDQQNPEMPESKMNPIYKSAMSKFQSDYYKKVEKEHGAEIFSIPLQQASLFGADADQYIKIDKDHFTLTGLKLNTIEKVYQYSCKYATIINKLNEDPGSAFIYGRFNKGSGNYMLGLCLEHAAGYERFTDYSVFISKSDNAYCSEQSERTLKPGFLKKKRYALLTGDTLKDDAKFLAVIELMNSYENRHGEYLKCVIASRVVRDGLNFRNILAIHLTGPDWNPSSMYQAIFRGIRSGSHDDLDPGLIIKVYLHAAVPLKGEGNDMHIYEVAYKKELKISQVMLKAIQCSIGCQIHYARNVRLTDKDFSSDCYYQKCQYRCVDPPYTAVDYSTYNAYYLDEAIKKLITPLKALLSLKLIWTLEEIQEVIPSPLLALEYIMNHKIMILNPTGFPSYLYQNQGQFYLGEYTDAAITELDYQLVITENTYDQYLIELDQLKYQQFLKQTEHIETHFDQLSIDNKIKYLEYLYFHPNEIFNKYKKLFFKVNGKPVHLLNLLKETNQHNFIADYFKANTKIKIYNQEWQDAPDSVGNDIFLQNDQKFKRMQEEFDGLFGLDIADRFLISYQPVKKASKKAGVARDESRGRVCTSFDKEVLEEIALKLKIKKIYDQDKLKPREELCRLIKNQFIKENRMF